MIFANFGRHFRAPRVAFRDSVLKWGSQGPLEQKRPKKETFSSMVPHFEKALFYVIFGDFFSVSEKAVKIELPKGGRMCNPTMPVHVS